MRRGTTPTFSVTVDADLTDFVCFLTFNNASHMLTKSGDELQKVVDTSGDKPVTTLTVVLTQEDTLAFKSGMPCEVQVRAVDASGYPAIATTIGAVYVDRILLGGVLP